MKNSVKGIIGLSTAVAVLGGGLLALKLTAPEKQNTDTENGQAEESTSSSQENEVLLLKDQNTENGIGEVKEMTVSNTDGKYRIIIDTPATEEDSATYTIDGYKDVPLDTSAVGTLAHNASELTASLIEENCTDTKKFGLDSPQAEVEVKFQSGSKGKFLIGDKAPANSATYVMIDGESTVYTISSAIAEKYQTPVTDFISKVILEEPSEDTYPIINSLKIEREDIDYNILLKYDLKSSDSKYTGGTSATHVMVEPVEAYLTVERSQDITNGMFGLESTGFFAVHCKESDIAQAGLESPFCTVTMECNTGKTYVLLLSEPFYNDDNEKCCYAMLEGGNIIYTVKTENARWVEVLPVDIASRIIIGTYVWNIPELSIKCSNGTEEKFEIKQKEGTEEKTALRAVDFDVTKNGEVFDSERYRSFYSFLVSAYAEEFALGSEIPDSEPMVTVEFTDSYTKKNWKIDFYDNTALTSLIVINGESRYLCAKSYVETLIDNTARINTGEEYVTTWK